MIRQTSPRRAISAATLTIAAIATSHVNTADDHNRNRSHSWTLDRGHGVMVTSSVAVAPTNSSMRTSTVTRHCPANGMSAITW